MLGEHIFETLACSVIRSGFERLLKSYDFAFDLFVKTIKVYDGAIRFVTREPCDRRGIYQYKLPRCRMTTKPVGNPVCAHPVRVVKRRFGTRRFSSQYCCRKSRDRVQIPRSL